MESTNDRIVRIGGMTLRFRVDETQGAGDLVMFEFEVLPKARVPVAHFHRDVDEAVYGLDGTLTTTVDGVRHEVGPGDVVFIPRGAVHLHENLHEHTARALVVLTPGTIGRRYFEDVAAEATAPGGPNPARMKDIMTRHGLIPA